MTTPPIHRIAVDGSGLVRAKAGMGTYTREILVAMHALRPQCEMTIHLPPGVDMPASLTNLDHQTIPGPRLLGRHWRWPGRLRRTRSDLYFGPAGLMPLAGMDIPSVITVHDLAIYRNPAWFPPRQPFSTRLVVPRSLRGADAIVAVSENTAEDLVELFAIPRQRIHVIHHGVSPAHGPQDPAVGERLRQRLALPERFILFVGTIEPRKNLDTLIRAVVGSDLPQLVIAGDWGWGYTATRARIAAAGEQVRVLGGLDPAELPGLYRLASVVAHPAWYEGFGLTPLEAMACGTPTVVSNTSSLPEVVGEAALLVPPEEVGGWRQALTRILQDNALAGRLRHAGLARAAQFTWPLAAEKTWRVIESVRSGGATGLRSPR